LEPGSIAIVGASSRRESISGQFLGNLLAYGFPGALYPVNPRAQEIEGLRCYRSVIEISSDVDLAVILVSKSLVCQVLEECAQKGVRYVMVPASGFAEAGVDGVMLQGRMGELARAGNFRLLGPNCMGFVNFKERIPVIFGAFLESLPIQKGNVGLVVHSGAFGGQTMVQCLKRGVGFTYSVSTGNEADLHALDFMEFLLQDEDSRVIAAFLESVREGERLIQLGRRAREAGKVVVVLKGGRSQKGSEAVASHTGRMAGGREVYEGILKQGTIIEAANPEEFWDAIEVFSRVRASPKSFGACAIVASGGNGILACDCSESLGLEMPRLGERTMQQLSQLIPEAGSVTNPVDVTAQIPHNEIEKFPRVVEIVCREDAIGVLVVSIADKHLQCCWAELLELAQNHEKLLALVNRSVAPEVSAAFYDSGRVVIADNVWRALKKVELLKRNRDFSCRFQVDAVSDLPVGNYQIEEPKQPMGEHDIKLLFSPFVSVPEGKLAHSVEEALEVAGRIGYPIVLKASGPGLRHKSDIGGVRVDIRSDEDLRAGYQLLLERMKVSSVRLSGILVEEMVQGGVEVAMGFIRNPELGPMAMLGAGGIFVELIHRVGFRLLPLRRRDAEELLEDIALGRLLKGFRNQPEKDVDALLDALLKLSRVFFANSWIRELELNPVAILDKGRGVKALDMMVARNQGGSLDAVR